MLTSTYLLIVIIIISIFGFCALCYLLYLTFWEYFEFKRYFMPAREVPPSGMQQGQQVVVVTAGKRVALAQAPASATLSSGLAPRPSGPQSSATIETTSGEVGGSLVEAGKMLENVAHAEVRK